MTVLSLFLSALVLAIAYFIVMGVKLAFRLGLKGTVAVITLPVRAPKKFIAIMRAKRADRKLIKENRAYWVVGQDMDKVENLARYKKSEQVISHPSVKAFELKRKEKANRKAIKENKKAAKSKASKTFDKIVK